MITDKVAVGADVDVYTNVTLVTRANNVLLAAARSMRVRKKGVMPMKISTN